VISNITKLFIVVTLLILFPAPNISSEENADFLRDDFNNLNNWEPLYFEKIEEHSVYSIFDDKNGSYLKAKSDSSASGLISKDEFNVYEHPKAKWRWRISDVLKKGNAKEKSGDDYPIRIYIIFKYDPEKASFFQRAKYGAYKKIYGEYPPHSSINYIWANREHKERIITNTYSDETKMIIMQAGDEKAGQWQYEEVNIVIDYREAFGEDPPVTASIAIMNDSDNTGESAVSYIDYIELHR
jgi:hypothetical protein